MKPARFDYIRADTREEALAALAEHGGEARILAGGQSLVPMLNMRLTQPRVLIDVTRVDALAQIESKGPAIVVPAAVRQASLLGMEGLRESVPLLASALPWVGHAQTRARGTVCGSVAHADPSAELPLCLVALDGTVRLRSKRSRREIAARDFFVGMMTTDRADDEMIEAVVFPKRKPGTGHAFAEFGRRHGDFAIVACAAVVTDNGITFAVGGVDDMPAHRAWPRLAGGDLDDALNAFAWELNARSDVHADARFRRDLVRSLGRKTIEEAVACIA